MQSGRFRHQKTVSDFITKFGAFGLSQVMVQGLGMISGILIVRLLSPHEYSLYIISLTLLGTMSVLADGGISTGVMAQGGKHWTDKDKLGEVIATGIVLRRRFAVVSVLVMAPIFVYMLRGHGASWLGIASILAGVLLTFLTSLSDTILQIAPKLHQQVLSLSYIQAIQSLARLVLVLGVTSLMPMAGVVILAAALPQVWANLRLRKITWQYASQSASESAEIKENIYAIVRRTLPGAIFFCVSSQITMWIIAIFGTTASVAQLGALGRISQITTIYSVIVGTLLVPRFARLPDNRRSIQIMFWGIIGLTLACGVTVVLISVFWGDKLLWLLGDHYRNLQTELIILLCSSGVGLLNGVIYHVSSSRGWVMKPIFAIPIIILSQVISAPLVNLTTLTGVLLFGLYSGLMQLMVSLGYCVKKMQQI